MREASIQDQKYKTEIIGEQFKQTIFKILHEEGHQPFNVTLIMVFCLIFVKKLQKFIFLFLRLS